MKTIYRYEVPVDHEVHEVELWGDPLAVGSRQRGVVEFWAFAVDGADTTTRRLLAAGTGDDIDRDALYWGTTADASGPGLIWHLVELPPVGTALPPSLPADGATPPA
jgi:hypothetical protein